MFNPSLRPPTKISSAVEQNLATNFAEFPPQGINVIPFSTSLNPDSYNQKTDDVFFDFKNSKFIEKRLIGMDQKASKASAINDPSSKILSNVSLAEYDLLLENHRKNLFNNHPFTQAQRTQIRNVTDSLVDTCQDLPEHQIVWASWSHIFPPFFLPPIRVPNNFALSDLSPESLRQYNLALLRMKSTSDLLYRNKVPSDYDKAADFLQNSEISKILGESDF